MAIDIAVQILILKGLVRVFRSRFLCFLLVVIFRELFHLPSTAVADR
jgi:hypothetical protein